MNVEKMLFVVGTVEVNNDDGAYFGKSPRRFYFW